MVCMVTSMDKSHVERRLDRGPMVTVAFNGRRDGYLLLLFITGAAALDSSDWQIQAGLCTG